VLYDPLSMEYYMQTEIAHQLMAIRSSGVSMYPFVEKLKSDTKNHPYTL